MRDTIAAIATATGGGVVFGGGESLLHARFIAAFAELVPKDWKILAETCLNVPTDLLNAALPAVDTWIVDIKDMNPEIYRAYTGQDNAQVLKNLRTLAEVVQHVVIRSFCLCMKKSIRKRTAVTSKDWKRKPRKWHA